MYFSWQCKKSTERGISYFLYTSKESNICVSIQRKIAAYIIFLVLFVTLQEVHRPPHDNFKTIPRCQPCEKFFHGADIFSSVLLHSDCKAERGRHRAFPSGRSRVVTCHGKEDISYVN